MALINPKAQKDWLKKKRDNWDWLKTEAKRDVRLTVKGLRPRPDFGHVKLYLHQMVCFLLMVYLKRFMLFLDMGGGKTLLTLMMIKYLKDTGKKPKAIVFVPYVITVETWIEETEKHAPSLKCVPLINSSKQNLDDLCNAEGDLFVICYQSAVAMLCERKESKKKNKKVDWVLEGPKVTKLFKKAGFNFLAMDEIHKCKNQQSITYRMCRAISKQVTWAYGLTGTPHGRNPEDLWAQFYLIDFGETLSATLGFFRSVFFSEQDGFWGGVKYKFKKSMLPTLHEIIKHRSIRYRIDECHDMPERTFIVKKVKPPEGVIGYYNKIVEALGDLSFGKTKYREVESKYMKLRQLASGFMTLKGDDSSKVEVEFPTNPKLDAIEEILDSMPDDSKMIIFHDFRHSNKLISNHLTKLKVPHARVWGGGKNNIKEIRRFKKDPKCRVLVINIQSGSSSQNLQVANYVVYYEQPRSSLDRDQSERRAWRPGQTKRVFFIDLLMEGTVDEDMKRMNDEGMDLMRSVVDGKLKVGKLI